MRTSSLLLASAVLVHNAASSPLSFGTLSYRQEDPNANATAPGGDGSEQTITVAQGDTLSKLATTFNTGICDIAAANNLQGQAINELIPGDTLTIPAPTAEPDNASCLPPPAPPATATCILGGPDRFVVQAGLSVEQTASFLNITMDALVQANAAALANATADMAGQVLSVPVCPGSSCKIAPATIKEGDILNDVAAAAGTTTGQILALNPGIDRLNLQIGQEFTLPSDCTAGEGQAEEGQAGEGQAGEGQAEEGGADGKEGTGAEGQQGGEAAAAEGQRGRQKEGQAAAEAGQGRGKKNGEGQAEAEQNDMGQREGASAAMGEAKAHEQQNAEAAAAEGRKEGQAAGAQKHGAAKGEAAAAAGY